MAQGWWNLDIETRCMQEVADAGEVRILQQQKRKKWWRGQWGKSTYETKWAQEIERHLGGRESSILKQDGHKKLLRDMPPPTFCPPSQVYIYIYTYCLCITHTSTAYIIIYIYAYTPHRYVKTCLQFFCICRSITRISHRGGRQE